MVPNIGKKGIVWIWNIGVHLNISGNCNEQSSLLREHKSSATNQNIEKGKLICETY